MNNITTPVAYAELEVTSNFSFLRGASHPEELVARAKALGLPAIGITDRGSLAGIVRAHLAAQAAGLRLVPGVRLDLEGGPSVLVYPTDRPAYARLCRLLSLGKSRAGKGGCRLAYDDLKAWGQGQIVILRAETATEAAPWLGPLAADFGDRAYVALTRRFRPGEAARLRALATAARAAGLALVATNDVLFHDPARRILQDVVTCIREGAVIDQAGFRRTRSADRFLKPAHEMARLLPDYPAALAASVEIVRRCTFSLDQIRYQYPEEASIPGLTPQEALKRLTREGAPVALSGGCPGADRGRDQP